MRLQMYVAAAIATASLISSPAQAQQRLGGFLGFDQEPCRGHPAGSAGEIGEGINEPSPPSKPSFQVAPYYVTPFYVPPNYALPGYLPYYGFPNWQAHGSGCHIQLEPSRAWS